MWMQPSLRPVAGDENCPGHKRFHLLDLVHNLYFLNTFVLVPDLI
jgi:hypothetical protein